MRTSAPLAAFVTLMAVASSNGAPVVTPAGSSARSASRARGQLRSRNVLAVPSNLQDVGYTANIPNVKCGDCRESEVKKVTVDVAKPVTDVEGVVKGTKNKALSTSAQVPGVPSSSESVDIDLDLDVGDNADPNDDTKTDHAQGENGGKADLPAEQPPCDKSNDDVGDVRDEVKEDTKVAHDEAHDTLVKVESKLNQAGDGAKATLSLVKGDVHKFSGELKNKVQQTADDKPDADVDFHAQVSADAKNDQDDSGKSYMSPHGSIPKIVKVTQEPSSSEDCEDETTVEIRKGNPSVSTSVLRR